MNHNNYNRRKKSKRKKHKKLVKREPIGTILNSVDSTVQKIIVTFELSIEGIVCLSRFIYFFLSHMFGNFLIRVFLFIFTEQYYHLETSGNLFYQTIRTTYAHRLAVTTFNTYAVNFMLLRQFF